VRQGTPAGRRDGALLQALLLLLLLAVEARGATRLSLRTELEGAFETDRGIWQKAELEFDPQLDGDLAGDWLWRLTVRIRGDAFDVLEPGAPHDAELSEGSRRLFVGDRLDLELREAFVEGTLRGAYLKLGKQQVVWGQADGLKVLDVVNPQSFREFILDEFADSRIPLWAALAELPVAGATAEFLWVPDRSFHIIPREDAAYAFTSPRLVPPLPPGFVRIVRDPERPAARPGEGDFGLKLSAFLAGFDLTLNYLYQYDKAPVLYRQVSFPGGRPTVTVTPSYERTHMLGGSFATSVADWTLRGEAAYFTDRFLPTADSGDADGVFRTGLLTAVLGVDYTGIERLFASLQFFCDLVFRNAAGSFRDDVETAVTAYLRYEGAGGSFFPELIWLHGVNLSDGLVRPKFVWEISDARRLWIGADLFYGDERGLFGQYGRRDRVVAGASAHF